MPGTLRSLTKLATGTMNAKARLRLAARWRLRARALLLELDRAFGAVLFTGAGLAGERRWNFDHAQHAVPRFVLAKHVGAEHIAAPVADALRVVESQPHAG